jgi:hypothetical protein
VQLLQALGRELQQPSFVEQHDNLFLLGDLGYALGADAKQLAQQKQLRAKLDAGRTSAVASYARRVSPSFPRVD